MTLRESIFIDTWRWLALSHRRDDFHQELKIQSVLTKDNHFCQVGMGFIKLF